MRAVTSRRFAFAFTLSLIGGLPALAADSLPTAAATPDLTAVRAKIKAEDYKSALVDLNGMLKNGIESADVYNLIGFSTRKSGGDLKEADSFYNKALVIDPQHKGALEYQGELFLQIGQADRARQNLATLAKVCPQGCDERTKLEQALAAASKT